MIEYRKKSSERINLLIIIPQNDNMRYKEDLEKEAEKSYLRREKKKKPRMKISGKNIFKIRDFIGKKGQN